MTYEHIVLVIKSEKQHDAALQDLRDIGSTPTLLDSYASISGGTDQAVVGYTTTDGFCSNGTLDGQQLAQSDVYVFSTRKEFIQEVKKYLV